MAAGAAPSETDVRCDLTYREARRATLRPRQGARPLRAAALETLGAEVVVPQLRETQLVAFTCLGAKKSGDIYTATDLALMASMAERCGEVIERIDLETLARESQATQSALRRYVRWPIASSQAMRSSQASAR
jgi:GAF domain-containing protein